MNNPKVSVIIPIYNVEKYLDRCLSSILNQTLTEIEIILVDDESPDNCPTMCDDYAKRDKRIKVIHKKNGGLGFARNSGLEIATGEFIAFVDSDDYVDTTMYEQLYTVAKLNDLDTIYCGFNLRRSSGKIEPFKQTDSFIMFDGRANVDMFLFDMIGSDPSYHSDVKYLMSACLALYSRDMIFKNGIKFLSEREFISEDLLFNIDYLPNAQKIGMMPDTFYYYCYNQTSLTNSYKSNRFVEQKKLYVEIEHRMRAIYDSDLFEKNLYRLIISNLRASITQEVRYMEKFAFFDVCKKINIMCRDIELREMFLNYPYKCLPIKHRIFFLLTKHRIIVFIVLMVYLDILIKK